MRDFELITDVDLENFLGETDRWKVYGILNERFHLVKVSGVVYIFSYAFRRSQPRAILTETNKSNKSSIPINGRYFLEETGFFPWQIHKIIKKLKTNLNEDHLK